MGEEVSESKRSGEYVEENGSRYQIPYQTVKELVFKNLKKEELKDIEHAGRLQYRLLLLDPVLKANVDFATRRIRITYNPSEAQNKKAKMSKEEIVELLAKEGISISQQDTETRDLDYYAEVYLPQYNPPSVREHPPYGYTPQEWSRMKADYEKKKAEYNKKSIEKFRAWREKYLAEHPELKA